MDFDDVLVNLSSAMYNNIRDNWRKYHQWFVDLGPLTEKEVQSRKYFIMNDWLIQKKYIDETPESYTATQVRINYEIKNDFFNTAIYDDLKPTRFAERTLLNPLFIDSNNIKKVYILSRCVSEAQRKSKENFVKKYFNHPKIEYINVGANENKGQALMNRNINWNLFIDDELPNIRNVAEVFHNKLRGKEFLIPKFGYNVMPEDLRLIIEGNGGIITYYDPYKEDLFRKE
jgi:hypothetical protein